MHLPRRLAAPIACGALLLALLPHAGTALAARASALAPTATLAAPTPDPAASAPSFARGALARRPYAVMIDNHPDAYPQAGLDRALVVFEALAEFGITRFMAVYAPGIGPDAPAIGPVRSARLYFVQWAMGFGPIYAHAGGSPQGLALAQSTDKIVNLDALHRGGGAYFGLSKKRFAPHNLFTSSAGALLRFYAADGQEVRFNAGQIWIVALPALTNLSVK